MLQLLKVFYHNGAGCANTNVHLWIADESLHGGAAMLFLSRYVVPQGFELA